MSKLTDKEKYVNVAELKKKIRYVLKSRGASKWTKQEVMDCFDKVPVCLKADLESTLESTIEDKE